MENKIDFNAYWPSGSPVYNSKTIKAIQYYVFVTIFQTSCVKHDRFDDANLKEGFKWGIGHISDAYAIFAGAQKSVYVQKGAFSVYPDQVLTQDSKVIMDLFELLLFGSNDPNQNRAAELGEDVSAQLRLSMRTIDLLSKNTYKKMVNECARGFEKICKQIIGPNYKQELEQESARELVQEVSQTQIGGFSTTTKHVIDRRRFTQIKIWLIVGCVISPLLLAGLNLGDGTNYSAYYFLLLYVITIPLCVVTILKTKRATSKEEITGYGIASLLFVSLLGGILILTTNDSHFNTPE